LGILSRLDKDIFAMQYYPYNHRNSFLVILALVLFLGSCTSAESIQSLLEKGYGLSRKDDAAARVYFQKAAQLGSADAMDELANICSRDDNCDSSKGSYLFIQAAEHGSYSAERVLVNSYYQGSSYKNGNIVFPADNVRAYMWANVALSNEVVYQDPKIAKKYGTYEQMIINQSPTIAKVLRDDDQMMKDNIGANMSPSDIETATELANGMLDKIRKLQYGNK
jgi:TPR repeat protein